MNANIAAPLLPLAIPITDCHPDPTNARTGHAIDRIAASLRQYGQRKPIVVNVSEGGKIEAGNGTWEAAKSLGWTHIAAVTVEDDPMTAVGYGIADNRTGHLSEWDAEILAILAESLPPETYTGFEGGELEELLAELGAGLDAGTGNGQGDAEPQIDRAEELRQKWGTETGQLWQIGEHRLIVGDCTDRAVVERVMGGERADAIMTDPPYGMNLDTNYAVTEKVKGRKYAPIIGDNRDFDPGHLLNLSECPNQVWFGADYYCWHLPRGGSWLVWDKKQENLDASIGSGFELIWCYPPRKKIVMRHLWSGFTAKELGETRSHPTQKPVKLLCDILEPMGNIILDYFGGSGTTMVACHNLGRRCMMVEISPAYCAVILQRMEQAFGITGVLVA